jgi:hypothetical protein
MPIFRAGRVVVPKRERPTTNAEFIRVAPHGLYFLQNEYRSYVKATCAYNAAHPASLGSGQIAFLYKIHDDLYQFLDQRPLSGPKKNVITKALRKSIARLKADFILHRADTILRDLPTLLNAAAYRLIDSTLEFVEAFTFLDSLILKIKNRPTDWALKKCVAEVIIHHQSSTNSNSFPKFPAVLRALNQNKSCSFHHLSVRNYWNLKQQWLRGTYWHLIQP